MHTHSCVKCAAQYQDTDPDPYYCDPCKAERVAIAKEIDRKLGSRSSKPVMSDLQAFDASSKQYTSPNGRTISFIKVKL